MAKIHHLPHIDLPPEPLEPETDAERADRLEAENRVLRAYLNDLDKLVQRVLALRAHRGKLFWVAVGMAATYILAIATPFDEQLAGLVRRVFAGNQVAQRPQPEPSGYPALPPRAADSRQVPAPGESSGGPVALPPSSQDVIDSKVKSPPIISAPDSLSAHIPPGCLLHAVQQPPCRPSPAPPQEKSKWPTMSSYSTTSSF